MRFRDLVYTKEPLPEIVEQCFDTPALTRLKGIGMHCGCEYTSFPLFHNLKPYSRFDHSYGVAAIIYHFTHDITQTLAGAFHDISSPCFSHSIDFLNGDFVEQESTEAGTNEIIASSKEIVSLLENKGISIDNVSDYHRYPIADNSSPQLSSDRLEYTLSNIVNFGFLDVEHTLPLYEDIVAGVNEKGETELCFESLAKAKQFGMLCLKTSSVYISEEDRYSMFSLSKLLEHCLKKGYITKLDLYDDEPTLIKKLLSHEESAQLWNRYRGLSTVNKSSSSLHYSKIPAKLRYIDPFVHGKGRLSKIDEEFSFSLKKYLSTDLDSPLGPDFLI